MSPLSEWMTLPHPERVRLLSELSVDQLAKDYQFSGKNETEFRKYLARERELWEAGNVAQFETKGKPPNKEVVFGAWRDLDRAEAVLELIDNSIDAWLLRRSKYPKKSASELNIYIDVNSNDAQLTYEDNAGGISIDNLENLVIPGFSETGPLAATIGSYKTGGKKAIFRLATAARITTRYWNPAETSDDAISVQLDESWMTDPDEYEFPFARLKNKGAIEKGQTRYVLQLREEPLNNPWFQNPNELQRISKEIQQTYILLLIRHPNIHIYFCDRSKSLEHLLDTYDFSGTHDGNVDIRPQQITFDTELPFEGQSHTLTIEIVLGCRTTTGVKDGRTGGIDLYGNNRLFVAYDQETFGSFFPSGQVRNMLRGFININGPNVFIPWDTHKRHLNVDREVIQVLKKHKLIQDFFSNWNQVFKNISLLGKGQVKKTISTPLSPILDKEKKDLNIPHRDRVRLDPTKQKGVDLPSDIFVPKVKAKTAKKKELVKINLSFAFDEARLLASYYQIKGEPDSTETKRELATEITNDVLKKAKAKR